MAMPEGFGWGAGIDATVAEGPASASDLAAFLGGDLGDGSHGGPGGGNGFAASYPDDLALLASHGMGHVRLTLDWARIEPTDGRVHVAAAEHLRLVLGAARAAGLSVWACLHDGPLPGWFAHDERGFGDARSRTYLWARHVERVAETFGDLVHGWVPVHEPTRWARHGWLDGTRPPGRREDAEAFAAALEAIHLASVDAALRLRQDGHPVATAQELVPVFPARVDPGAPPTPDAEAMASVVDETLRRCWLRMLVEETLVVPGRPPVEVPGAREAFDLIGFTYRHGLAVRGDGALLPYPQALPLGPDGQVAWSEGLAVVLHQLADAMPERPLLLAGVGLATDDESRREDHLRDVLSIVTDALNDGIDLRGCWWDTPIDGPIGPARGLFDRDRTPRPAAALLADVAGGRPVPS